MEVTLRVGKKAPGFKAKAYTKEGFREIDSQKYHGQWICLFFYPFDFTFVCPTEIRAFADLEAEFKRQDCQIIACSTDSEYSHKAWFERDLPGVQYPILADTNHSVSKTYNVLVEERGISLRGTFLIDPDGVLQWMSVNALGTGRSVEEVLRTLEALKTGEMCPVGWKPGQATL